jgi:hypothetical protein
MRWSWRRRQRRIEFWPMANHEVLELQIAKEILAEVFHARSIRRRRWIQRRLEEWSWCEKYRAGCDLPCYAWVSRYWTDVSRA